MLKRNIVITGALGQDGVILSKLLLKKNFNVIGIVKRFNSSKIKDVKYHKIDLLDYKKLSHFLNKIDLFSLIHLGTKNPNYLELKQKGHFIYREGNNDNAIENETRYLNRDEITAFDRFFFKYGAPFDDVWKFETGVVQWFGVLPMMGAVFITVWVGLPLLFIFSIYHFFF